MFKKQDLSLWFYINENNLKKEVKAYIDDVKTSKQQKMLVQEVSRKNCCRLSVLGDSSSSVVHGASTKRPTSSPSADRDYWTQKYKSC